MLLMTKKVGCTSFSKVAYNVSAMSSGGFRTTHYQNTTNDNRKHRLPK